ncbi:efflux RND transporter permease subunit [Methylobacterium sp. NEAU K]|uniref:efflux RND transporter permease subunit n=1 Tax=Methylobacterium sp. NEAU K TaxID=3064946 RepID=UPI002733E008|nr:efflux RND transporter permease subunit [Methylobacterium sp. NEAU K]MDP4003123.1 efflux RND transporter permease subunit [Methylobacterium sp. NEAU K]
MIAIVRLALHRPYTFVVMAMLIMIFGIMSALRTPTDIFPNIGIPVISVVWSYNGLPPDQMSGRVIFPYERSLTTTVNDIDHIESQSLAGYGIVKIFFQPSVNINAAQAQVTAISQTVLKSLPAGITPPSVLTYNASSVPIIQLALSSNILSQTRLNDLAGNFIRPQLTSVPGAALPSAYGGAVRQVQVDLDQSALHSYGLSAQDVVNALSVQNLITPVGTQKIGAFEYTVNLNNSPQRIRDFNDLPVKTVGGAVIYMRDVAYVHDSSPPQTNVVQVDGHKAVLMSVLKAGSASTLDIIAGVKRLLPGIKETLPSGVDVTPVGDQSGFVKSAVSGVIREGVIAAALTGLMILLFLGSWRSTLIITVSIPLAILASLTTLSIIGETINVMTLGGLALAVGILVDDATVTIENINWHLEHGKPIERAILDGAEQIVVPATVSLLCICIAFVPMFGLGGVGGFLFRPLAEAVVFAMIASYILSRTLVPTMANFLLRNQVHHHAEHDAPPSRNPLVRFRNGFERVFESIRSGYVGLLQLGLKYRAILVTIFLVLPLVTFGLAPSLGQNFFPEIDAGAIKMHVRTQTGTRIEETNRTINQIEEAVRNIIPAERLEGIVDNIGMPVSGLNIAYGNSGTIGVSDADVMISLKGEGEGLSAADYIKILREKLPDLFPGTTFAFLPADIVSQILNFGAPAPLDIQIVGSDLAGNRNYANALIARIRRVPGVADARIQQAFQAPALGVHVDRSLASLVGLTERDATTSIQNTLAGSTQSSPTFFLDPKTGVSYPISVQTPQYRMDTLSNLRNLPVVSTESSQLLGGIAHIEPEPANALVSHYNVRPAVDIYATVQERDLGGVAADIQELISDTKGDLPKGAKVEIRGQVSIMNSAYQQLFVGLAFAIVLIYLLIVITFQSWIDPLVIVMALPTALAGIVWMLFWTHTTLSVPALTGAIMCMGVATANSILIISFARERLAAGADALTAAIEAGSTRFRPVMMTALAMVIGMAPMALEHDANAPLGRAVIGGLIFATFATLFFVPTLFSLSHGRKASSASPKSAAGPVHA